LSAGPNGGSIAKLSVK
nr:RecName: Full=Disease resistance response protein [Pseudotsuga menziesii]